METARSFGARVGAIRRNRGLSQEALARRIDRSVNTVSAFERGKNTPSFETILRLAAALGVPVGEFFAAAGGVADSPRQAALFSDMLADARRLPSGDLELASRIFGLIVERYGR